MRECNDQPKPKKKGAAYTILLAFLIGAVGGILFWVYFRISTAKFPINFIHPQLMVVALSGLAMGIASALKRPISGLRFELLMGIGLVIFTMSNFLHKDASVHFLLFSLYYKYPAPSRLFWVMTGHALALLLSPLPFLILARRYVLQLADDRWAGPTCLVGAGAGLALSNSLIPLIGAYPVLLSACMAIGLLISRPILKIACLLSLIGIHLLFAHPREAFYTWQIRDYDRLASFWTPYYKVDYLGFGEDHCLACVHNMVVVWYVCDDPDRLLIHYGQLNKVLSEGNIPKRRVLSVGRTNGHLPLTAKLKNPNLEYFLTVEYDRKVTSDLLGPYARYNAHLFSEENFEAHAEDIRFSLQYIDERFDMMFINGAGIMLFFYPLTFITQEDYLYSEESYQWIFDHILTEDGVLIIDRGSSIQAEVFKIGGSLPADVHMRSFWIKVPDFPFAGLPLSYVIASRNESELNRITEALEQGNLYTEIPHDPVLSKKWRHRDDKPFMQPTVAFVLLLSTIPFLGYLVFLTLRHINHHKLIYPGKGTSFALETVQPRRRLLLSFLTEWKAVHTCTGLGILYTFVLLWITSLGARSFSAGAPFGFVIMFALFLTSAALILMTLNSRPLKKKMACRYALFTCVLSLLLLLIMPFTSLAAITSAIGGGASIAAFSHYLLPTKDRLFKLRCLLWGFLFGILLFQWSLFFLGFRWLAASILLALFLIEEFSPSSPRR